MIMQAIQQPSISLGFKSLVLVLVLPCVSHHTLWQQVSVIRSSSWLQVCHSPQESMLGSGSLSTPPVSHTYAPPAPCLPPGNAWHLDKELRRQCQSVQPCYRNHSSCFAEWRCSETTCVPLYHCHVSPWWTAPAVSGSVFCWSRGWWVSQAGWWFSGKVNTVVMKWDWGTLLEAIRAISKMKKLLPGSMCVFSAERPGLPTWLQRERAGLKVTVWSCLSTTVGSEQGQGLVNRW